MDEKAREKVMRLSFEIKICHSINAQAYKLSLIHDCTSKFVRISW